MILRELFTKEEVSVASNKISTHYKHKIGNGFDSLVVSYQCSDLDVFTYFTRHKKVYELLRQCVSDRVFLTHSKLPLKLPYVGGFTPHQDAWFWYEYKHLTNPSMCASLFVALEDTNDKNGALCIHGPRIRELLPHSDATVESVLTFQGFRTTTTTVRSDLIDNYFVSHDHSRLMQVAMAVHSVCAESGVLTRRRIRQVSGYERR